MSADEIFSLLTLETLSYTALQAQLQQSGDLRNVECNAHVEFQLTPSAIEGAVPAQFALQIRLTCMGTPARGTQRNKLFDLELRAVAVFRQVGGDALSPADFASKHTVFARQLFPALSGRAQSLLHDLGLSTIRLPLDLPQQLSAAAQPGPVVLN